MRYLSVCSGIEAATVAWHPLGWRPWAFAEIEAFPSAVLAHHYPTVPNLGDMTGFKDWPDATLDLLCGGTPCQSFSNAGLRAGLDDPRGQLMLTFGAIAARYRPRWLVWENVPGVLSSNGGRDFGAFLGLLGFLGYGFAYRVLDAQFVRVDGYGRAVPQRRQRVFVVGCLGDWRRAAAVLLERESLRGDSAPRRRSGASVTAGPVAGTLGCRSADHTSGLKSEADFIVGAYGGNNGAGAVSVSTALTAHPGGRYDYDSETFVAHTLRGEGFDASEDGTGRGTPLVAVGVDGYNGSLTGGVACTMGTPGSSETASGPTVMVPVPFDTTQITSASNYSNPKAGDPCHPLAAGAHAPAVAFGWQNAAAQGMPVDTISPTLDKSKHPGAMQGAAVRRLMPVECERLQGFPDGYTAIPWRGKPASECPDGPRYKALGNSWAVNCARWIGRRINLVEQIHADRSEAA